ncbi:uncharacterized protein [Misgurnus anguillicaudatus]|uniref:uncharacterized protein isoform X2 n=1 Tax=Misgurnus anguillicaudatus TaxID=75329 RepID=UPI003CCF8BAB
MGFGWTQDSSGIMISWLHCTSHPVTHWRMQTTGRDDKHGGAGDHYRGTGGGSEHYGRAAGAGEHYEGPRCLSTHGQPQSQILHSVAKRKSQVDQSLCLIRKSLKGSKADILVDWEPCPVCDEIWTHPWQPKDSLQIN